MKCNKKEEMDLASCNLLALNRSTVLSLFLSLLNSANHFSLEKYTSVFSNHCLPRFTNK